MASTTMPDDDAIREALRAVEDPEAGMTSSTSGSCTASR